MSTPKRKPPAFQLYADDFLAGTADMTPEEVGIYIRLLCHQWAKGGIPNDPERAGRMAGLMGSPMGSPCLGYVLAKFSPCADGMLRNDRLEKIRQEMEAHRVHQSISGAKGAEKRWKHGNPNGNPNGVAIATPLATPMAKAWPDDSSPSPSPSPKNIYSRFAPPAIEEVKAEAFSKGLPETEADKFWLHYESVGWKVGGKPMKSWKAALGGWKMRYEERPKPNGSHQKPEPQVPIWKQEQLLEEALRMHPGNPDSIANARGCTDEQREDYRAKKAKLRDIRAQLQGSAA